MNQREPYDQTVERLAREYQAKGFDVRKKALLPFEVPGAPDYEVDMLVERGDEHHVIEVKVRGGRDQEKRPWGSLAHEIRQRQGWHFQIVSVDRKPAPSTDPARIDATLAKAEALRARGDATTALLVAASGFEAAARRRLADMNATPRSDAPSLLVERLVSEGELDQEDFVPLRDAIELRNAVAHGALDEPVSPDAVTRLVTAARRLLPGSPPLGRTA